MDWIEPKRLAPGMTIGIMAPASASDEDLHRIEQICKAKGYKVLVGESARRKGLYGGTPEEQAVEFQYMMTAAPCDTVLALRGGYGTMRYLDLLDYKAISIGRLLLDIVIVQHFIWLLIDIAASLLIMDLWG